MQLHALERPKSTAPEPLALSAGSAFGGRFIPLKSCAIVAGSYHALKLTIEDMLDTELPPAPTRR